MIIYILSYCYIWYDIPRHCDINCAGHFTLDGLASRPVACILECSNVDAVFGMFAANHDAIMTWQPMDSQQKRPVARSFVFSLMLIWTDCCTKSLFCSRATMTLMWRHCDGYPVSTHKSQWHLSQNESILIYRCILYIHIHTMFNGMYFPDTGEITYM